MEIFLCSVIFPSWHKQQFLGTALKILRMPFLPISLSSFLFLFAHDCLRPHHEINHPHLLPRSSVAPDSTLSPLQPVTETRGNRKKKSGRPVTSVHSNPYARIPRSRSRPIVPTARPLVQAAARPTKPFCLREQSSPRFVSTRPPLDSLEIDGPGIITFSRRVCC